MLGSGSGFVRLRILSNFDGFFDHVRHPQVVASVSISALGASRGQITRRVTSGEW